MAPKRSSTLSTKKRRRRTGATFEKWCAGADTSKEQEGVMFLLSFILFLATKKNPEGHKIFGCWCVRVDPILCVVLYLGITKDKSLSKREITTQEEHRAEGRCFYQLPALQVSVRVHVCGLPAYPIYRISHFFAHKHAFHASCRESLWYSHRPESAFHLSPYSVFCLAIFLRFDLRPGLWAPRNSLLDLIRNSRVCFSGKSARRCRMQ